MNNSNMIDFFSIQSLSNAFNLYPVFIAVCISVMLDIRAKKNGLNVFTGAVICGLVSFSAINFLDYLGISEKPGLIVGSIIGLAGADRIRKLCIQVLIKKIRGK